MIGCVTLSLPKLKLNIANVNSNDIHRYYTSERHRALETEDRLKSA